MKSARRTALGFAADQATPAVVHYFTADPLRSCRADRIARDLGLALSTIQPILDHLVAIGVLERKSAEHETAVYVSRVADQFLDVLDRLSTYFNEQLEDVAISPDRAQLVHGEPQVDAAALRSLRARVASLEAANALLQRKNLELSFLYEASLLLASSIDVATLGQTAVDAVINASREKVRSCFVALADGDAFVYQTGRGIERVESEQYIFRNQARLRQCVDRGEVVAIPLAGDEGHNKQGQLMLPMIARQGERGYGCIVLVDIAEPGLSGDDLRTLTQLAELAARSLANASLYSRSVAIGMTDELTGLLNRRYLDRRLNDEVKRAQRSGSELSAIILDLDLFKSVNDRYGHPEGDRLLQTVARTVTSSVRDIDVVTRFGGEEFAVILPGAGARDAAAIAERIRHSIAGVHHVTMDNGPLSITASCGVATLHDNIHTPAQLIAAADRRLLEAKRSGRNKTVSETVTFTASQPAC